MYSSVLTVSRKKKPIKWDYILHDHVLKYETSIKYLGCTITSELDWGEHINNITNKASGSIGFLHRNLQIGSKSIKEQAYKTLVRPQLEYATTVWDPYHQKYIEQIEKVQRRSLQERHREARLAMMYKIVYDKVAISHRHLSQNFFPIYLNMTQGA